MYERIAVIGHSLGSVVAYDIVRDYWTEVNQYYAVDPRAPQDPATQAADQVDRLGEELWRGGPAPPASADPGFSPFQQAQRRLSALWPHASSLPPGEKQGRRWAITDLVTLACPLTHADLLLGSSSEEIIDAQWRRTLASCPPRRQMTRSSYRTAYTRGPRRELESLHQAACFAIVRWTNVFFAADSVGGPLGPLFGPGVVDIELPSPRGLSGLMPKVHSAYARDGEARAILRRVVWDGAARQDPATLAPLLRASVERVLSELIDQQLAGGDPRAAAASLPSLRRLTAAQHDDLAAAAARVAAGADLSAVLDQLCADPQLLGRMPVIDPLREQLAAEDAAAEAQALGISELPSAAAIAVEGGVEPDGALVAAADAPERSGGWPATASPLALEEFEEEEEEEEELEEEEEE